MKNIRNKTIKIVGSLLLSILLFVSGTSSAIAQEKTVTGVFPSMAEGRYISWNYKYSDDFFLQSPDEYNHDLARLSLGLALAAFRDEWKPETQDEHLLQFLDEMGFEQIETDTYRTKPTADSIGYGLALKQVGDTTIIVCAVCGGGYGAEWASNVTVNDGVRSAGFQDAATKVEAAISDYLARHPSTGGVRLWISGFSRAAAVSNITAADFTDAGTFDAVFAYTFATPRTTREPKAYRNIFNIMQKDDLVPKVPLADWDFGRYGTDLFMVSVETDFDNRYVIDQAKALYKEMEGSEMIINTDINYQLRILTDYLLMLFPDPAYYAETLQPLLVNIMAGNEDTDVSKDALQILMQALREYSVDNTEHQDELKALLDYLETLINVYVLQGDLEDMPEGQWDSDFGIACLFNEHFGSEYLAMLFASDDPAELYTDRMEYIRLVIDGKVEITISDGDKVMKTVTTDGKEIVDGKEDPSAFPDVNVLNGKTVITLPADRSLDVTVRSDRWLPQTVTYTGLLLSNRTMRAKLDDMYSFIMNKGETKHITTSADGRAIKADASDYSAVSTIVEKIYSPTTAMRLENNNIVKLTISGFVNKLLIILIILIVQAIASIILAVIRKKKHIERNTVITCVWHAVIALLFAVLQLAMWYFIPAFPIAWVICGLLVCIVIFTFACKGYRIHKENRTAFILYSIGLVVFFVLQILTLGEFSILKSLILLFVYLLFFNISVFFIWRQGGSKQESSPQTAQ